MSRNVDEKLRTIMIAAKHAAKQHNCSSVEIGHIVLSALVDGDNRLTQILTDMKIDSTQLYDVLYDVVYANSLNLNIYNLKDVNYSPEVKSVLANIEEEALSLGETSLDIAHVFLTILKSPNALTPTLTRLYITYKTFKERMIIISRFDNEQAPSSAHDSSEPDDDMGGVNPRRRPKRPTTGAASVNRATQTLDEFCRDITEAVKRGEVDMVVGREKEIKRVTQILSRRRKNNPILIGEAGVGKCFSSDTEVFMRDDLTGETAKITVKELLKRLPTPN
jgi:ATP-dependent Clp protease ATP-binding subunit ClpC